MKVNIKAVNHLIDTHFRGNKTWFAEEIGIDRAYLTRILNGKEIDYSPKCIRCLTAYCESNNLNYKDYIILP